VGLRKRKDLDDQKLNGIKWKIKIYILEPPGAEMPKEKFEDALNKLEKIVSKLEEGDIPLEESLKLFEEGIRLSRFCNQKLDEAEKKVEILLKGKNGTMKPHLFDPSTGSGDTIMGKSQEDEED
jgi:exodeoxyribonuclease VII small subunit